LIVWTELPSDTHRQRCPACDHRTKTLGITVDGDGRGVAHCFRCSFVETYRPTGITQRLGKPAARPVETRKHETLADWGRALWGATKPLSGVAAAYLDARACVIPPKGTHLRWLPELKHPSGYIGPALVALITDVHTREPLSLHRTWIKPDGNKADLEAPRLLLKNHRKAGGVVRLWPDEHVGAVLGIAEGIESALSLAHAVEAVWSVIDAGNLQNFPVLTGVQQIFIGGDNDPAGIKAAYSCGNRWAAADREARVLVPEHEGWDLNDVARAP
jgi:putative DNA primase/helicase